MPSCSNNEMYEINCAEIMEPVELHEHDNNEPCPLCLVSENSEAYQYILALENAKAGQVCGKALAKLESEQYNTLFAQVMRDSGKQCDDIPPEVFERHFTLHKPSVKRTLRDDILKCQQIQDNLPLLRTDGTSDSTAAKTYMMLVRNKLDLLTSYEKLITQSPNLPALPKVPNYMLE